MWGEGGTIISAEIFMFNEVKGVGGRGAEHFWGSKYIVTGQSEHILARACSYCFASMLHFRLIVVHVVLVLVVS